MSKRPAASVEPPFAAEAAVRRRLRGKQPCAAYALAAAPGPHAAEVLLRPAGTTHECHGVPDQPCRFSTADIGRRARYHDASRQCPWCNPTLMERALATSKGQGQLTRGLRFFWENAKAIFVEAVERLPAGEPRRHFPLQALGLSAAFHSAAALETALGTAQGRGRLLGMLRKKRADDGALVDEALKAIPEEHVEWFRAQLAAEPRRARAQAARAREQGQWEQALQARKSIRATPVEDRQEEYAGRVAEDRARVQRKFFPQRPREVRHTGQRWSNPMSEALRATIADVAANDTGPPATQGSEAAGMLEQWCKLGSWAVCATCHSLEPRHLKEVDCRRVAAPLVQACRWCRGGGDGSASSVPQPTDVPRPLRGLSSVALAALRPLDLDCGNYQRPPHGYRVHTALARLSWCEEGVAEKVAKLPRQERKKAEKALRYLMRGDSRSEYRHFVRKHNTFLRQNPEATDADLRRPLQMLEAAPGVECAVWPDLYWDSDHCETVVRGTDVRRLQRQGLLEDDGDEEDEDLGRGSVRRSFLKKILGPILDYAAEYSLMQFIFDLTLWSDLGAKRHACPQMPMRIMLKGSTFTPAYWALRHAAVLDLQRQCGFPVLFKTWAPYEWSAPYHRALLQQLATLLRSRQHSAGLETLHLAHILVELLREWVAGGARKQGESSSLWRQHSQLATAQDGRHCRINFAARLEFQDGKRKEATQSYHGRGAVHLHAILFAEDLEALDLHEKLLATEPPPGHPLRGYIMDQLSYNGSGWPVEDRRSHWDPDAGVVRLQHTQADQNKGVRAYNPEEVEVLKCHVDNLMAQASSDKGRGLLMRYVATYDVKFSSSFSNELLADPQVSGYGLAFRVLSTYHPSEPEMWLTLFPQLFPQFVLGGTMQPIVAPWPGMPEPPGYVTAYEQCAWRDDRMTLLEYLRKANGRGDIIQWIQRAHAKADTALDLADFACQCRCFGEKVIAAEMVSVFNDKFFGQWLMLNVPFRKAETFLSDDIVKGVPARYRHFACALRAAPAHWRDAAAVRSELELAAHKDTYIRNALALIRAQTGIVERYLSGELTLEDEVPDVDDLLSMDVARQPVDLPRPPFNAAQRRLEQQALCRMDAVLAFRSAGTAEDMEAAANDLLEHNSILVCMGAPGTGKTFVADYLIRLAVQRGMRVLYALPTGQLACRMRQRHPGIEVDTCHGAFAFWRPLTETIAYMADFDMVVIDEALQLSAEEFGRLRAMFVAAGKQVLLLLMGDDWQLPSIHPERADSHPQWTFGHIITLREIKRCKCPELQAKLDFLRCHKPMGAEGKRLINRLCYKHKAWTGHEEPTALDIESVLAQTDGKTTFVTCTRRGASIINDLVAQVLFTNRNKRPIGTIPGDYGDLAENYTDQGRLREDRPPLPNQVLLYVGLRVLLTRNQDKQNHYVNGMLADVEAFHPESQCLQVLTQSGKRLAVYPFTDTNVPKGRVVYYPVRVGYAGTIHKYQGAELQHVTLWLDRKYSPAAGYVALSRVARDEDYLIGGIVTADHFIPAK
ncbi:ATP-dependent DNA helicase PIF1 [Durusdinium trenchii]|uniref:ATP-dependent DNA helicase PIF1 n=1 Tax=Durusdinium trenchii TaxID=1381693 RepID=A0ABP0RNV3_9DINO